MRTARSSSRRGGLHQAPPKQTPPEQTPPDQAPPSGAGIPPSRPPRTRYTLLGPGTPPPPREQNSWHKLVKILPSPKLRLRAVTSSSGQVC